MRSSHCAPLSAGALPLPAAAVRSVGLPARTRLSALRLFTAVRRGSISRAAPNPSHSAPVSASLSLQCVITLSVKAVATAAAPLVESRPGCGCGCGPSALSAWPHISDRARLRSDRRSGSERVGLTLAVRGGCNPTASAPRTHSSPFVLIAVAACCQTRIICDRSPSFVTHARAHLFSPLLPMAAACLGILLRHVGKQSRGRA